MRTFPNIFLWPFFKCPCVLVREYALIGACVLAFVETRSVAQHVVRFWKYSVLLWKDCVLQLVGLVFGELTKFINRVV